jgi:hypothetical protein
VTPKSRLSPLFPPPRPLQAGLTPESVNPLAIHRPTVAAQQRADATIAITRMSTGEHDQTMD